MYKYKSRNQTDIFDGFCFNPNRIRPTMGMNDGYRIVCSHVLGFYLSSCIPSCLAIARYAFDKTVCNPTNIKTKPI